MFKRRARLQSQIDSFHTRAADLWLQQADYDSQLGETADDQALCSEDDDDDGENVFIVPTLTSGPDDAERTPIFFPSQFSTATSQTNSMHRYALQEISLREGQANDALQGLRLALSTKSVMFRTDLRHQKKKKGKTRAWANIHNIDRSARHFAQVYKHSRQRLINLCAPQATLDRYQELQAEHMDVKTTIIDPATRGTRYSSRAWFWSIDVQGDIEKVDAMSECEFLDYPTIGGVVHWNCTPSLSCALA